MRLTIAVLLLVAFASSGQQLPQPGGEQVYVTAIEVVADVRDAKGKVPDALAPADFIVIEDGVPRTVVGVEYLRSSRRAAKKFVPVDDPPVPRATVGSPAVRPTSWQNVIYFETNLSSGSGRITAAKEMLKHVDRLVEMGTVDVVLANPTPRALVRNSRDPVAIRAALQKVASSGGANQLATHRRQFQRETGDGTDSLHALKTGNVQQPVRLDYDKRPEIVYSEELPYTMDPEARREIEGTMDSHHTMTANQIRPYIELEINVISDFRESLVAWLSSYARHVPRNLLLVTDGFDLDPLEFYSESAPASAQVELQSYVAQSALGGTAARMAEALVAGAWTAISIPSDNYSDGWVDDTTSSGVGRIRSTMAKKPVASPKAFFYRPHDPLLAIAEVTGGSVVPNSSHLGHVLEGLDDRIKLTYQVDRKPDQRTRKIEVRMRDEKLTARTARFAMSVTPDVYAQTRAIGLLKGATYQGDLRAESAMEWATTAGPKKSGTLRATANVDLVKRLLPARAKGQFRVTVAVQIGKEAVVVNREIPDYDLSDGVFRLRTPLDLPSDASAVVVVVEEKTTGVWGSTKLDITTVVAP